MYYSDPTPFRKRRYDYHIVMLLFTEKEFLEVKMDRFQIATS